MEPENRSFYDTAAAWAADRLKKNRLSLLSSLIFGLLAYMFAFTNKLVNHDDIVALFSKGTTVSSGRWGTELLRLIFPDYSMPWAYGILSLLLMAVAICVIMRLFSIENKYLTVLLSGAIIVFPSMTSIFTYMYTSSTYAVAFLLAVLSVWLLQKRTKQTYPAAVLLLTFSVSIYQSFVAVAASLLLVLMIRQLVKDAPAGQVLRQGLGYLLFLAVSLALYLAITWLVLTVTGAEFHSAYAGLEGSESANLLMKVFTAYKEFLRIFLSDAYGLINNKVLRIAHLLIAALTGISVLFLLLKKGNLSGKLLMLLCLALLPLSINCFCLLSADTVHTIVLYSFVSLYIAAAVIIGEGLRTAKFRQLMNDALVFLMAAVVAGNIYVANTVFLELHLMYENTFAFYTELITQVKMTPGYDENTSLAIVGDASERIFPFPQFSYDQIVGVSDSLINAYSRNEFILYYLGYAAPFSTWEEIEAVRQLPEFAEMPVYPYYGSVQKIGDYIVVKLSQ